jgi:hypothetical protein
VALAGIGALAVVWNISHQGYLPAPEPTKAGAPAPSPATLSATTKLINRGEYLARAGDCVACHTEPTGKPFAGGRAMPTPFGNIYVPNITPDDETGIGLWSSDDFYRAMHNWRHARRHADVPGDALRLVLPR